MARRKSTLTANEVAADLGTDPRTARRFLRRQFPTLQGQPGNWSIDRALMPSLRRAWRAQHARTQIDIPMERAHKQVTLVG